MKEEYEIIKELPEKIKKAWNTKVPKLNNFDSVVFVGMGGSRAVALALEQYLREKLGKTIKVCSGQIPLVNKKTLVVLLSYSGNSKEILEIFNKIKSRAEVVVLTSGGELLKKAVKNRTKIIKIEPGLNHRFVFINTFFPALKLFSENSIKKQDKKIKNFIELLEKNQEKIEKQGRKIAEKIYKKIPVVYCSEFLFPIAYRWKINFEEDAKVFSKADFFPEVFHHEIEIFPEKNIFPLILSIEKDNKLKKEIDFFKKILRNYHEIRFDKKKESSMFLFLYLGEYISYYLSLLKQKIH
jgi:glucose/mannose-6-phosphate isomerase